MTNAEFGKASRLLNARDFKNVFDHARLKVSSPELLFLAVPNNLPYPRLGLVIAKKNVRLAVQRNRVKRIIRESFRQQQTVTGLDIVVLARRGLDTLDNPQLHDSCHQLWKQLQRRVEKQARRQQQEQEAKSCE